MTLKRRKNRTPHPMCPLSDCMAFIGGAWTPNIIWYLSSGPRRFSELRVDIPLVSAKVLTQRWKSAGSCRARCSTPRHRPSNTR
jgi:DNA-binding HxlR family transcriptional regulator